MKHITYSSVQNRPKKNTTPLLLSDNTHQTTRDAPDRTKDPYHRLGKRNAGTGFNNIYLAFSLIPLILLVIITFMACKKRSYVRVCRDDDNSIEMYEISSESSEHDIYSADDLWTFKIKLLKMYIMHLIITTNWLCMWLIHSFALTWVHAYCYFCKILSWKRE